MNLDLYHSFGVVFTFKTLLSVFYFRNGTESVVKGTKT